MKVLVIAAHPDDETIGAGGAIARLAASGDQVTLWIATDTYEPRWEAAEKEKRRAQAESAAQILGITDLRFGGLKTMHLSAMPAIDLANAVSGVVNKVKPEVLLAPPPVDVNSDHSALFDAALVAARGLPGNPIRRFYAYEIGTTTRFAAPARAFAANTYVDITDTFQTKLSALAAYESETREFPHPRSPEGLDIIARERGLAAGFARAEAFMLVAARVAGGEARVL
jgi:LmbE family N-acetylglucosaminyl deacetylase